MKFRLDFIGIGAPKCGTCWIGRCLSAHPMINFCHAKESCYFLTPASGDIYKFFRCSTLKDLKLEFDPDPGRVKGEYSTDYIYDPNTPQKIKDTFPEVKIIVSLRNPVDMLYSRFWFWKSSFKSSEMPATFEDYVRNKKILNLGLYASHLKRYYRLFERHKILPIIFEDIKERPKTVCENLYQFLKVDPNFIPPDLNKIVFKTTKLKYPILAKIHLHSIKFLMKIGAGDFIYRASTGSNKTVKKLYHVYVKINRADFHYPPMAPNTRQQLKATFSRDILELEKLINRDLSRWKK